MRRAAKVDDFVPVALTIKGKPTSKKTGQRQVFGKGRMVPIPSADFIAYQRSACLQLAVQFKAVPINQPCHLTARFYRDNRTDVDNMLGGLLDILQKAQVLKNDRCVCSVTATKSGKCDGDPRVEVFIVPYRESQILTRSKSRGVGLP